VSRDKKKGLIFDRNGKRGRRGRALVNTEERMRRALNFRSQKKRRETRAAGRDIPTPPP
jgi:hypothetical protein